VPHVVVAAALESDEARQVLGTIARDVQRGTAALAVAAPAVQTVVRRLRAPFASVRKAARVWPSLLDVELPFPVEAAACAFGPARVENDGTVAIAAAIRHVDLAAWDDRCRAAGCEPTHADAEVLALWEQLALEVPPVRAEQPRALAWLGADHAVLIRGRGTECMAAHVLRASPMAMAPDARPSFGDIWASRMSPILAAHLAETESTELTLWWGGPAAEDEVVMADLRRRLSSGAAIRHEDLRQPASLLARALARRAVAGNGVNFKTGDCAHPARLRKEARARRMALGSVAAAAVLVLALNGGEAVWRQQQDARWQEHLTTAAQAIAGPIIPRGQEVLMVERALTLRDEETEAFRHALDPVGVEYQAVRVLEDAAALEIDISRLTLSPLAITLEGAAASIQAVERLVERLERRAWAIQSDTPGRTPDNRQRFILKGALRHED
jgi:type II secretory pathway component PulL